MIRVLRAIKPDTKKKVIELCIAGPVGRWFRKRKWAGQTTPLPFMVLIFYWVNDNNEAPSPYVRVHEMTHVSQDEQNSCFLVTWINYFMEVVKNGYWSNKYEREAYLIERSWMDRNELPDWCKVFPPS